MVYLLVLEEYNWIRVADGGFEESLGIFGAPRSDHLEAGDGSVPGGIILGVLGSNTRSKAVGASESNITWLDTAGHIVRFGRGVDDMVDCLHGKVEGHEFALYQNYG